MARRVHEENQSEFDISAPGPLIKMQRLTTYFIKEVRFRRNEDGKIVVDLGSPKNFVTLDERELDVHMNDLGGGFDNIFGLQNIEDIWPTEEFLATPEPLNPISRLRSLRGWIVRQWRRIFPKKVPCGGVSRKSVSTSERNENDFG